MPCGWEQSHPERDLCIRIVTTTTLELWGHLKASAPHLAEPEHLECGRRGCIIWHGLTEYWPLERSHRPIKRRDFAGFRGGNMGEEHIFSCVVALTLCALFFTESPLGGSRLGTSIYLM